MTPAPLDVRGQAWDSFDAYLFDIDGTLLHCQDAVHYFAFCEVLREMSGRKMDLDGIVVHGNTDIGILRDALLHAGVEEDRWRAEMPSAIERMGGYVCAHEGEMSICTLPYVHELLSYLGKRALIGVATGNLSTIGSIKLQKAGIFEYFRVFGWSDGLENRIDVFQNAMHLLNQLMKQGLRACVVGDTPYDISAAHKIGLPCISVGTGIYTHEDLLAAGSDLSLSSFADLFLNS